VWRRVLLALGVGEVPQPFRGQRPIFHWSDAQVVLAANAATCQFTNDTGVRPTLSYYPLREPTRGVLPASMELFQFAMYNLGFYSSTSGRHPGTDFLEMTGANQFRSALQVTAAGDGTLVGYCDPTANPTSLAGQPSWVAGVSPTDKDQGRAYVVFAHGKVIVQQAR
jgi:hypothetical protein